MSPPLILIIDDDPQTEQDVLRSFANQSVGIITTQSSTEAMLVTQNVSVILCSASIGDEDGYDIASRLCDYHPSAALFMLMEGSVKYDVQRGRVAGAIGALVKPLCAETLFSRLQEFLDIEKEGKEDYSFDQMDYEDRIATLIDYSDNEEQLEKLVKELMPTVMDKVLRIQLAYNPNFREMIERIVREIVEREVGKVLQSTFKKTISNTNESDES